MPRAFFSACIAALTFVAAVPAVAQSPWNGTWKLNPSKSQMTGETFTVTRNGNMYHYKNGNFEYDYACDGKEYPIFGGQTMSCQQTPTTEETTVKLNAKTVAVMRDQLEPDGNAFKGTRTNMLPDGGTTVDKATFTRVGQGTGWTGTWKLSSAALDHPSVMIYKVEGDSMHFESPEDHTTWDGKLDGTPAAPHGPTVPGGMMISEKTEGPHKLVGEVAANGKQLWHWEDSLSADGKSFTEVGWNVAKPDEKQTYIFEKQ